MPSIGSAIAAAVGGSALALTALSVPFLTPAFRKICIPYVPATAAQVQNVLSLLSKCPPPVQPLVDLGSGDGRIFGEHLGSHLTPEWRKQYIRYEELKALLYNMVLEAPTETEARDQYISQMDESFFAECDKELTKIALFFSQKIAESKGQFHELSAELTKYKDLQESARQPPSSASDRHKNQLRLRFGASKAAAASTTATSNHKLQKEQSKTAQQLKLAFSEFYLNLVLLQNYQQLNAKGFSKILKKHDKLMSNARGLEWRINRVEKAPFFLNTDIEALISNVEGAVINDLEAGNRQAGMKRLKVPPLSEKQNAGTTFTLGLFLGIFLVLAVAITLTWLGYNPRPTEPKWVAVRLFRGFFLFFAAIWLCGLNMYGWAAAGVNHVLIFEVDPRQHLTYQDVMRLASFLLMVWALCVLGYLYAPVLHLPPFLFPMLLMVLCVAFLLNPFKTPEKVFYRDSRFWLLKHCYDCFTAPFHFVTFTDFWLGDQMNSLATCLVDLQYFICFYVTEVDYSGMKFEVRSLNITEGPIPWGYVDVNTGQDMCVNSSGVRSFVMVIPATVRFLQCLRRYRDTKRWHPHLVNAGKYATTFLVVATNIFSKWASSASGSNQTTVFFYLWIGSYIISFAYTFLWDVFMDWGLIDPKAPKGSPLLREEIIYARSFYYFAIVEDFVLRLGWVFNVSLAEAWLIPTDMLQCILSPLEVFRRWVWNFLRLENEHLNNCGQFRAVRDISVRPIRKGDLDSLLAKMDMPDGVSHRGAAYRIKKHKRGGEKRRHLLKNRLTRISMAAMHPSFPSFASSPAGGMPVVGAGMSESKQ